MPPTSGLPDQLSILHLSDLHFGKDNRYPFEPNAVQNLARSLATAIQTQNKKRNVPENPNLILVTGDIAQTATVPEYKIAQVFFETLSIALAIDPKERRRFIFVPGNHDVSWDACEEKANNWSRKGKDPEELSKAMMEAKFEEYNDFVYNFQGAPRPIVSQELAPSTYIHNFPEWRLSVAALNSSLPITHREAEQVGGLTYSVEKNITVDTCQALMDAWKGIYDDWVKIAAIHHNPGGLPTTLYDETSKWLLEKAQKGEIDERLIGHFVADTMGFPDAGTLENTLTQRQTLLLFHGHQHHDKISSWHWEGSSGQTHVLAAGSLGLTPDKLPKDQSNQVHVAVVDINNKKVRTYRLAYDPTVPAKDLATKGYFLPKHTQDWEYEPSIVLPDSWVREISRGKKGKKARIPVSTTTIKTFIAQYRASMARVFDVYDFRYVGMVPEGGTERPKSVALRDMYQPLRFAKRYSIDKLEKDTLLTIDDLAMRKKHLAITGPAGSGKTTWMRHTFCTGIQNERVFPIMIELRRLVASWKNHNPKGEERALETYIEEIIAEYLGLEWKECVIPFLNKTTGPRPILLVDGWDELGEMGEELRRKLIAFLDGHKHILAVVTSRPYGVQRPGWAEGFDALDIQPLNDKEVEGISERFFRFGYQDDLRQQKEQLEVFLNALKRSEGAQPLARVPLLITMMLLISRSSPLPDKRHQLYQLCIENLLTALPARQELEWVQITAQQWRPDDSEERFRIVAHLAATIQEKGYKDECRSESIVFWQEEGLEILPKTWKPEERSGFLIWLAARAGILVDREDGTYMFTHLSFQEYLTAWHWMQNNIQESTRFLTFKNLAEKTIWWETLRLWAALIQKGSVEQLDRLIQSLLINLNILDFIGCIFADGLGSEITFCHWLKPYIAHIAARWPKEVETVIRAWAATRQEDRKKNIGEQFNNRIRTAHWLACQRLDRWYTGVMGFPLTSSSNIIITHLMQQAVQIENPIGQILGCGRILCGGPAIWPGGRTGLLQVWPSQRRLLGLRLQSLASLSGTREKMQIVLHTTCRQNRGIPVLEIEKSSHKLSRYFARKFLHSLSHESLRTFLQDFSRDFSRDFIQDFSYYFSRYISCYLSKDFSHYLSKILSCELSRKLSHELSRELTHDFSREFSYEFSFELSPEISHELSYKLTHEFLMHLFCSEVPDLETLPSMQEFAVIEIHSFGRIALPSILANLEKAPYDTAAQLLHEACIQHYKHASLPSSIEKSIDTYREKETDRLWPYLAKHIAGIASEDEQNYLIDLVKNPRHEDPQIADGLKYIVRGDVVFDDGSEATLDELCAEIGEPSLPYLEPMLPLLEIDWDKGD